MKINCSILTKFKFIRIDGYDNNHFIYFDKCGFKVAIEKITKEAFFAYKIYHPEIGEYREYKIPLNSIEELKEKYNKHVDNEISKNNFIIKEIKDAIEYDNLDEIEINRKQWWLTECKRTIQEIKFTKFKMKICNNKGVWQDKNK